MSFLRNSSLSKKTFFILLFLLPLNLGKHFITRDSYVFGLLVDYLIPSIYLQDILAASVVVFWFFENPFSIKKLLYTKKVQLILLFMFSLFLSVLGAERFEASLSFFARTVLYAFVCLFVISEISLKRHWNHILKTLSVSLLFLGVLGIIQFVRQGAVFNNYLFFGEQPYNVFTPGLTLERLFGRLIVPAYGLFRHPNIFGGFLSILLIWLCNEILISVGTFKGRESFLIRAEFLRFRKFWIYYSAFFLGFISLIITFSYISWVCFLLGFLLLVLLKVEGPVFSEVSKKLTLFLSVMVFSLGLFLPSSNNASFYRRSHLLVSAYRLIQQNILFGVGFGNVTARIEENLPDSSDVRFVQPVHNIFVLSFAEAGVFAFLLFTALFLLGFQKASRHPQHVFSISLFQLVLLGSFDHYFMTMHQTHLLFWIVLGLCLVTKYDYN